MLMSRTDTHLEIALSDGPRIALDLGNVDAVSLSARRASGSAIGLELVIQHIDGAPARSIAGPLELLCIVHQRIVEALGEVPARAAARDCAPASLIDWLAV